MVFLVGRSCSQAFEDGTVGPVVSIARDDQITQVLRVAVRSAILALNLLTSVGASFVAAMIAPD